MDGDEKSPVEPSYKWHYKWVTGVITLLIGVITPFITGRGPTLYGLISYKL